MIEENAMLITDLLIGMDINGVPALHKYLNMETDYFTAPASTKHHYVYEGGLAEHSLDVYGTTMAFNRLFGQEIPRDDIVIASLLHDLCKTNYYVIEHKWRKDDYGKWESYEAWGIKDGLPLGHGEKSLYLASKYLDLNSGVAAAIRWHMGAWTAGVTTDYGTSKAYNAAVDEYPLVRLLIMADFAASRGMVAGGTEE
jgi:hypothetical protein